MANPPEGSLKCYVCGWDKFDITHHWIKGIGVRVDGNSPFPVNNCPQIHTILCSRCDTLHYVTNKGWYIGNINATWDEENKCIKWPDYKRTVRPESVQERELKAMLSKLSSEELKKLIGG